MNRTGISGHEAGVDSRLDERATGQGFERSRGVLFGWYRRMQQRRELAALSERDLAELGIPPALAAYEAGRWPWQKISREWQEFDEAGHATPPAEPVSVRGKE